MANTLSSKEVLERAGISRATLNNYISLGILPPPQVHNPSAPGERARRLGHFPEWVLDVLQEVQRLKSEGLSIRQIADRVRSGPSPGASQAVMDETPTQERSSPSNWTSGSSPMFTEDRRSSFSDPPQLTFRDLQFPAYFVDYELDIQWCNQEFGDALLGMPELSENLRSALQNSDARNIIRTLIRSPRFQADGAWEQVFRFHFSVFKSRMPKPLAQSLFENIPEQKASFLRRVYDESEPFRPRPIIETVVEMVSDDSPALAQKLYAAFFREGVLFVYVPIIAGSSESILDLLTQRDRVIHEIMANRLPVLTPLCVLVADIQDSVKISVELPPEEYFELVNEIWGEAEPIFRRFNGTPGKHVGDGLVYYFFPRSESNYILNAIHCAQTIKRKVAEISKRWQLRKRWDAEIYLNVGLNQGREWFGSYYSGTTVEFTALGDTINFAGRLSDFARFGAIWATKNMLSELDLEERKELRFGIRKTNRDGQATFIENTYSRISDIIDLHEQRHYKFNDIANLPIAEVVSSTIPGDNAL